MDVTRTDQMIDVPGGTRRLRLLALATFLGLAATTPAGAAVSPEKRLISPQYQAKTADTAATVGATARSSQEPFAGSAEPRSAIWYRAEKARYQFQRDSQHNLNLPFLASVPLPRYISDSFLPPNQQQITTQIRNPQVLARSSSVVSAGDARLLLRLGLGLGLAYVLFLAAWFWRTRNRTHDAAARLVRF